MSGEAFRKVFLAVERRRGLTFCLLLVALGFSAVVLTRLKFDNTLDLMLPADSPAQRMMTFLRDSALSSKVVVSLELSDTALSRDVLLHATSTLADGLQPPLYTKVLKGWRAPELMKDTGFFLGHASQLLASNDLARVEAMLSPEAMDRLFRRHYLQLMKPEGMFMAQAIRQDPLELGTLMLGRLQALAATFGYEVEMENGCFVSRDGRHTLLVIETTVPLTDGAASRRLLADLRSRFCSLPKGVGASVICGHTHVVSNDELIKRDLGVILGFSSLAFIVLYIAFFRDPRGLLIFLVPALAAVVAVAVTSLLFPRLSYFVMAFGPVIAGIADDYGIAVYVAVRYGRSRIESVGHVFRPVVVGAITTTAIFFAFFFSKIPGYHQLACFCVTSIFLAVFLALFLLPHALTPSVGQTTSMTPEQVVVRRPWWRLAWIGGLGVFLVVVGGLASGVRFDSDIARLDGTAPDILADEQRFQSVWGGRNGQDAMIVVVGDTYEEALRKNDVLFRQLTPIMAGRRFASLAAVWPSREMRSENMQKWSEFWADGREARLRNLLAQGGVKHGFATNAFEPFLGRLRESPVVLEESGSGVLLANLKERFVQPMKNGHVQVMSYFPDDPKLLVAVTALVDGRRDVFLVSRSVMSELLSSAFSREMLKTAVIAGMLILLTVVLFLRRFWQVLVVMVPSLVGVVGMLGVLAAFDRPFNVANLISGIVVFGLCIDFGVHILYAWRTGEGRVSRMAVTFAAATTLMGAGVLLFARHPALHSIGLTLVSGVGCGYVAAVGVVPVLCEWFGDKEKRQG